LFAYESDAIELGHDEIARDHVRIELFNQIERFSTVTRSADNLDERTTREDLPDHLPHVSGIVDHHHS
jgi:hypothetical protein